MFIKLPHLIKVYDKKYTPVLEIATIQGLLSLATSTTYAVLPLLLGIMYGETWAGAIISIGNLLTLFITPITGELANRNGALTIQRMSLISFFIAGLVFLLFGGQAVLIAILFLFLGYGLRTSQVYILQMAPKKAGGLLFGLSESIIAIGTFVATLLIPWFEQQSIQWIGGLLIASALIGFFRTYKLPLPHQKKKLKSTEKKKKHSIFDIFHDIKKGVHFIKKNKGYPLFHLHTMLFEGLFYASIWFIFPLLIATSLQGGGSGLTLGVYEIITVFLAGFCGLIADKIPWRQVSMIGWALIGIGAVVFIIPGQNLYFSLIIGGILIGIGNNMIFGASTHILEKKDKDHKEDGSFVALQRIVENIGFVCMPLLLGIVIQRFSIISGLYVLTGIVVILSVYNIIFTLKKR